MADIALAGRVIASHYAAPVSRTLAVAALLRTSPAVNGDVICKLAAGAPFAMLDDSLGWAWGYAGADRLVGYVKGGELETAA